MELTDLKRNPTYNIAPLMDQESDGSSDVYEIYDPIVNGQTIGQTALDRSSNMYDSIVYTRTAEERKEKTTERPKPKEPCTEVVKTKSVWVYICVALVGAITLLALLVAVAALVITILNFLELQRGTSATNSTLTSCQDVPPDSPPGNYLIQVGGVPTSVYCDTNRTCCNTTGGWMRVANLDMTDPSQQCPEAFLLIENSTIQPSRICGIPETIDEGCASVVYPTHGVQYSRVCGKVIGYQFGETLAFGSFRYRNSTIDDMYLNGVSLTHGQNPRKHIWSFAAALLEATFVLSGNCPCIYPAGDSSGAEPPFLNGNYFCATGNPSNQSREDGIFYNDDPLWDGQGCDGVNACCTFNNPPYFCQTLPDATRDDIELRLCGNNSGNRAGSPLETVQIYVR